ncbi:MAG TPA: choice-of-anchor tandem repeat GloVer-containing protein [Verrucomicrobiae bacterium]|nr:choice-of-anchor tandem repeat GloVer-containing protein [Verrucomicrobiae bacterium]
MKIFGPVALALLLAFVLQPSRVCGQTLTPLWSLTGSSPTNGGSDGSFPDGGLIQGSDGNFYGTASHGGTYGYGSVFRISPDGELTTLHAFGAGTNDGASPQAGLVEGPDSNFYGTTSSGGTGSAGVVFRVTPTGAITNLYGFHGSDGNFPACTLALGSDGYFYGTTPEGGTNYTCPGGCGTVFRISSSGVLTTLYEFAGWPPPQTYTPGGGLVQGNDGDFYGTTQSGGANGDGAVFRISPSGSLTVLHSFSVNDGLNANRPLARGSDGNLYGSTSNGGTNHVGAIFQISTNGVFTYLHTFGGNDGKTPQGGLMQGSDGNLYGTTYTGGTSNWGTIFRIDSTGNFTNLFSFTNSIDAAFPYGPLVQGADGNLYGTTFGGGTSTFCSVNGVGGCGTVFMFSVPMNPPANQISSVQSDSSGTNLVFGIPSVAGETYQLQFIADLTSGIWSNVPGVSVTNSIGAMLTLTNVGGAVGPQGFYRFAITP